MKSKNHPLSLRIPGHLLSQIDRRSLVTGQPRSSVIVELIANGISSLNQPKTDPPDLKKMVQEVAAIRADLQKLIEFVNN
jgi:hypothetical protein